MKRPHQHLVQAVLLLAPLLRRSKGGARRRRTVLNPRLEDIARAKPWFRTNNVAGIVVSRKTSGHQRERGELSLKFLVRRKLPASRLSGQELIPSRLRLSSIGEEILTDVEICPESPAARGGQGSALALPPMPRVRPVTPGIWIGHPRSPGGTLGLVVKRGGEDHYLSCAHVLAPGGNSSELSDPIEQPADLLGSADDNAIGTLAAFASPASESMDAAVAKANTVPHEFAVPGIGVPSGILALDAADFTDSTMVLARVGAKTGLQRGAVDGFGSVSVFYEDLGEQVTLDEIVIYDAFNDSGDSGAAVFVEGGTIVAGMHIGALSPTQSLCIPIHAIFDRLKLTLP